MVLREMHFEKYNMTHSKGLNLKQILNKFYKDYDFAERISYDPIKYPHKYKSSGDIEVSGFIASCLAYGRVELFMPVINRILSVMGESPYDFFLNFNVEKHSELFNGIRYRFNGTQDIILLLYVLQRVLKKYGSIEACFKSFYDERDDNIGKALSGLISYMLNIYMSAIDEDTEITGVFKDYHISRGFLQFFPSPKNGSACKRMNLFLRWMIRDRDIDFGIWKGIPKNKLVIPLDTHIARISRCLGFTARTSQDWKMAVEITDALKRLDSEDPLKYDFALCHQGISRLCNKNQCDRCSFSFIKNDLN